eukprot:TRINITY_DN26265_c0_g1_i1.p1 TRINITY_DN26265_c0_g1~~TRINITY_DN26265_c0_g1_i1.p1  ORF type:complete len:429 (+),score=97.15 TRINITY_DN26265_c0_g1_i1:78-1364(+)
METPRAFSAGPSLDVEEARIAELHLEIALDEEIKRLRALQIFVTENKELTRLVQELPRKTAHEVMVPFGKAAFFPGRLVHTNELVVLLGEGLHVLRSATQTVGILERRGEYLDGRVQGMEGRIANLRAEVAFASGAVVDSEAGVVEIREPYDEATSSGQESDKGTLEPPPAVPRAKKVVDDETERAEHARIMARIEELELAEASGDNVPDEEAEEGQPPPIWPFPSDDISELDSTQRLFDARSDGSSLPLREGDSSSSAHDPQEALLREAAATSQADVAQGGHQSPKHVQFVEESSKARNKEARTAVSLSAASGVAVGKPKERQGVLKATSTLPSPSESWFEKRKDSVEAGSQSRQGRENATRTADLRPSPQQLRAFTGDVVERGSTPAQGPLQGLSPRIQEVPQAPSPSSTETRPVSRFKQQRKGGT